MNERQIDILKKKYNVAYDGINVKFTRTQEGLKQEYLFERASVIVMWGAIAIAFFVFSLVGVAAGSLPGSYVFLLFALVALLIVFWNFYKFAQFFEDETSVKPVLIQIWKFSKMDGKRLPQ
jgi:hypothetical protein